MLFFPYVVMTLAVQSGVPATVSSQDLERSYIDDILGVAIFDVSGLPREYFITPDSSSMNWVQTVFQSLGLKSLLMSSLRVDGFRQATIRTTQHCAVVVKQRDHYIALLMPYSDRNLKLIQNRQFSAWLEKFEAKVLRNNERFCVV